jgi:hypothetical protein
MDDLDQLLQTVSDEDGFLIFLEALAKDRAHEVEKEGIEPSSPYGPGTTVGSIAVSRIFSMQRQRGARVLKMV